jgi:AraC-like DNA-binding protein
MLTARPLHRGAVRVVEVLCSGDNTAPPAAEQHHGWSIAYVRRGSFGCSCRGRQFQLVPGALLLGRPGDEYTCSHDHHAGGDECLAFHFTPDLVDELRRRGPAWESGAAPPLAPLGALAEMAQAALRHEHDVAIDELGLALGGRCVTLMGGAAPAPLRTRAGDAQRAVCAAMWIDEHSAQDIDLARIAQAAGLSVFHFLRLFAAVIGVTPHQYLVRCRLRKAAHLLADEDRPVTDVALDVGFADLSNFVRSFHRAAGLSPRAFRRASRGERKICQERLGAAA